jgi:Arc/MetJ family transcription regulator
MRIQIDDELLTSAMAAARLPTKKATVEEGLRLLLRLRGQVEALRELQGIGWTGDDLSGRQRVKRKR